MGAVTPLRPWLAALVMGAGALHAAAPALGQEAGSNAAAAPEGASGAQATTSNDEAHRIFVEGDRKYSEGDYRSAAELFQKAYDLSGHPAMLFNLANAHERLGDERRALELLRRFEEHAVGQQRIAVAKRIARFEERLAQQEERARELEEQRKASEPTPRADPRPVETAPADAAPTAHTGSPEHDVRPPRESATPVLGYALLGLGGVGLGLGGFFGLRALDARARIEDECAPTAGGRLCPASAQSAVDADARDSLIADLGFAAGATAGALGLYLILTQSDAPSSAQLGVDLRPTPRGGSLRVKGRF